MCTEFFYPMTQFFVQFINNIFLILTHGGVKGKSTHRTDIISSYQKKSVLLNLSEVIASTFNFASLKTSDTNVKKLEM